MPKILIAQSQKTKTTRRAHTSLQNMKALLKKRAAKDPEDSEYVVVTLLTPRLTLPVVCELLNSSFKRLKKRDDVQSVDRLTVNTETNRIKTENIK